MSSINKFMGIPDQFAKLQTLLTQHRFDELDTLFHMSADEKEKWISEHFIGYELEQQLLDLGKEFFKPSTGTRTTLIEDHDTGEVTEVVKTFPEYYLDLVTNEVLGVVQWIERLILSGTDGDLVRRQLKVVDEQYLSLYKQVQELKFSDASYSKEPLLTTLQDILRAISIGPEVNPGIKVEDSHETKEVLKFFKFNCPLDARKKLLVLYNGLKTQKIIEKTEGLEETFLCLFSGKAVTHALPKIRILNQRAFKYFIGSLENRKLTKPATLSGKPAFTFHNKKWLAIQACFLSRKGKPIEYVGHSKNLRDEQLISAIDGLIAGLGL